MKLEMIGSDIPEIYLKYLSQDEIYRIKSGHFSAIGAVNDENDKMLGLCILEILPDHILLHRLFSPQKTSARQACSAIVDLIKQMPAEAALPVYYYSYGMDMKGLKLATNCGFCKEDSSFYIIDARLSDMSALPAPSEAADVNGIQYISDVSDDELYNFISGAEGNKFFRLPYSSIDRDRFDGSLVYKRKGMITAILLIEDTDEIVTIPWFYNVDKTGLDACFYELRRMYLDDGLDDTELRFVLNDKESKTVLSRYFTGISGVDVDVYRLPDPENE